MLETPTDHALRSLVLQPELGSQIGACRNLRRSRPASLTPRAHSVVCELRLVVDDRPVRFAVRGCSGRVHRKLDNQRHPVCIFIQRRDAL